MRIKRLRLKNGYKRFRDLTIDLGNSPARIVALVGPNGCGKSSVLDGMLFQISAYQTIGTGIERDYTYHSLDRARNFSRHENVEILFDQGNFEQVLHTRNAAGTKGTMFSFRSPYRYNSSLKIMHTQATEDIRHNRYGARDASSLDDKIEENYRRLLAAVADYMERNDVRPSEARKAIIGDLNASIRKCLDIEIASLGNVEASEGTLYFIKPDHPEKFEFNVLSSGEKQVVDLLLDLYLRRTAYDDTIFLIDEPELHINTAIQPKLLTEINRLVGENCQIWLTTHSIGFLRTLQSQLHHDVQIIQFRSDGNYASQPATLRPDVPSIAMWRDLFSVALDDLTYLVCPKILVYCEGRTESSKEGEEQGLDALVYNTVFAAMHPETLFVSSGGNTELDQRSEVAIAILQKVIRDLEILVLKDRDAGSGKSVEEDDRKRYLELNPPHHRMLKRWEIENYLYDKDVLKSYCAAEGLTFDESTYDQFFTDIDNQSIKDETARIRNICSIRTSISSAQKKIALARHLLPGMAAYYELESCIFHPD